MEYLLEAVFVVVFLLLIAVYILNRKVEKIVNVVVKGSEINKKTVQKMIDAFKEEHKRHKVAHPQHQQEDFHDYGDSIPNSANSVEELFAMENTGGGRFDDEDPISESHRMDYDPL